MMWTSDEHNGGGRGAIVDLLGSYEVNATSLSSLTR